MQTMKLIGRIEKLLGLSPEDIPAEKLRKTIRSLKQKQEDLEERLKRTRGKHSRRNLKRKIESLRVQRARGAEAYRQRIGLEQADGKP